MKQLRVLHITARADTGGGPKHVMDLTSTMKKLYPEIEIFIASPNEEPFASEYQKIAKEWIEVPKRKVSISSLISIYRFFKRNNINLVHSHGRGAGYFSRFLKLLTGVKVVHTFHGVHKTDDLKGWLKNSIDVLFKPLTDQFICVSEDEKIKAIDSGLGTKNKIAVVLNGVNIDQIQKEYQEAKRQNNDPFVIGTLARLNYQKGIDILLNNFARYFDENPNSEIKVLIAGDGEEKESLLNLHAELKLDDRVMFIGNVSKPITFLKELDLYISFARWEGLPISVLEAMACGLPVLLSDVTGHQSFPLAKLFDLKSYSSFVDAISDYKASNLESKFTVEEMVKRTLKVY